MKPIIKKYENKDLNIAYNDGYETEKKEILEIGDKIFYSKNYGNEYIDNDKFSYAIELWEELKQQLTNSEKDKLSKYPSKEFPNPLNENAGNHTFFAGKIE